MTRTEIKSRLISAVTAYDRRAQRRSKSFNPYALGLMFQAVDRACEEMDAGVPVRDALMSVFCDRLLTAVLKAVGEPDI